MDDPVAEIRDVVRSLVEPYEGATLAANVEKYFTEDATLQHPFMVVTRSSNSREAIKGIYKLVRVNTLNQKITFKSVMFNEDKTQVAIDLMEHMNFRRGLTSMPINLRLIVLLDLVKGDDGKYRISRQEDNFPSDTPSFFVIFVPGMSSLFEMVRNAVGYGNGVIGSFLLSKGWLGL